MEEPNKRVFVTDCEGPVTKNDNAAELAAEYIPEGHSFFAKISLYDDYLAEVIRKPGYKAGDTLRLILPFFKAFGLKNQTVTEYSRRNIAIIPQADRALREILKLVPSYIVSTSYSPYVQAVCSTIGFPFENAYCTQVDLDAQPISDGERSAVRDIHAEILKLPDFEIPSGAASADDLAPADLDVVRKLDEIFWAVLPGLEVYALVREVNPIGGIEKARAVEQICAANGISPAQVIYFGDSITDVDAFRLVKSGGGMAVSFNGNDWAVREADFAVTAENGFPLLWLTTLFIEKGVQGFEDLAVVKLDDGNVESVSKASSRVRKGVRSERIGSLG